MNMTVRALADRIWDIVPGQGKRYIRDLCFWGRDGVRELVSMLDETNGEDTVNASFALEAWTEFASRPGADDERRNLAAWLAEALGDCCADDVARAIVVKCLQLCGGDPEVPSIARWLAVDKVRDYAIMALAAFHTEASCKALLDGASAASDDIALEYVSAFAELEVKEAAPLLRHLAGCADAYHRVAVMNAQAAIGDGAAADSFLEALKAPTETERAGARGAIAKLARNLSARNLENRAAAEALALRYDAAEPSEASLAVLLDVFGLEKTADRLFAEIDNGDFVRRNAVLNLLRTYPSDQVVPMLLAHAPKAPSVALAGIVALLGQLGDARARDFVKAQLAHGELQVRSAAFAALPSFGTREAVRMLMERLAACTDEDEAEALRSVVAWQQDDLLVALAVSALASGKPRGAGKCALLGLLAARGTVEHSALAFDALMDDDASVRLAALKALDVLATPAEVAKVLAQMTDADDGVRKEAQHVLVTLGRKDGAAVSAIVGATADAEGELCVALMGALTNIGGKLALDGVVSCLPRMKAEAVAALAQWPDAAAEAMLWAQVDDPDCHDAALAGLTRISSLTEGTTAEACVAKLKNVCKACRNTEEATAVLKAVGGLRCDAALESLAVPALADEALQAEACEAIVQLACSRGGKDPGMGSAAARAALEQLLKVCKDDALCQKARKQLDFVTTEEGAAAMKLQAAYAF